MFIMERNEYYHAVVKKKSMTIKAKYFHYIKAHPKTLYSSCTRAGCTMNIYMIKE